MIKSLLKQPLQLFGDKLQIDANYFAWGTFYTGMQQIIGVICGFIVSYLFGNFVSKTVYGEYNLVLSTISMITFLSLPGIDTALIPAVSHGHDKSFLKAVKTKMTFSILGSVTLLGFALYYFFSSKLVIAASLCLAAFIYPFLYSFSLTSAFLTAKRLFKTLTLLSSFSSVGFLLVCAISIFMFPTVFGLTSGYALGIIIPALIAFIYVQKFINKTSTLDPDLISYSSFLTLLSILPWISSYLGQIILGNTIGAQSLAVFAIANGFLASVQKSFIVFYKPITAKLAAQSGPQHFNTLRTHGIKFVCLGILLGAALWITVPFLITFLFRQYPEAIPYGQMLSLALIPLPLTWVLSDMMIYQKNKQIQIAVSIIPHFLKILFYIVLIPIYGIWGLVFVTLLDRYSSIIIYILPLSQKLLKK